MKKIKDQVPNPFPSLGTSASIGLKIKPIGYDEEIEQFHNTIKNNIGHQAMIFNIVGNFGYGKTLFLNYFKNFYKEDFFCIEYNLEKFESLGSFFLDCIANYEKNYHEKKGLIFFIDETENIFEKEKKQEKVQFLDFLRDLPDGKILNKEGKKVDISYILKKIIIFFGIHPQTAKLIFFERQDLEDRYLTQRLDLDELDYYSSEKIVKVYMAQKEYNYLKWFDKGVITTTYLLTSHVNKQRHKLTQKNPRIFLEIFFKLFDYITTQKLKKLSINILIDLINERAISIGAADSSDTQASLKLNNPKEYSRILQNISESDKNTINSYIFNARWNYVDEKDRPYLDEYKSLFETQYGYIMQKQVFKELKSLDLKKKLKDQIRSLPRIRIFNNECSNDECFLVFETSFYGLENNLIKGFFDDNNVKSGDFFRLRNEYLELFFDYVDSKADSGLYDYLKTKNKSNFFFKKLFSNYSSPNLDDPSINKKECQLSFKNLIGDTIKKKYTSLELSLFPFLTKWERYNIYFIKDSEIEIFNNILGSIIENQYNDTSVCEIIILEPYINERKIEAKISIDIEFINKIRIIHPDLDEFGALIGNNPNKTNKLLNSYLIDSRILSVKELLDKSYLIPLTNLKIQNEQNLELFKRIIESDLEYEDQKLFNLSNQEIKKPILNITNYVIHDDNVGIEKAIETLKKFFEVEYDDEYDSYHFKPLFSDFEFHYLNILFRFLRNNNSLSINRNIIDEEIERIVPVSQRKFCKFKEFIPKILQIKKIVKLDNDIIKFINPTKYLKKTIRNLDQIISFDLDNSEKKKYSMILKILGDFLADKVISRNIYDLDFNLNDKNKIDTRDYLVKISFSNYICSKLESYFDSRYIDFNDELVTKLISEIIRFNYLFEKTLKISCPNTNISIKLSYNTLIKQEFNSIQDKIALLLDYIDKIKNFSQNYFETYSKKILKVLGFVYLFSSYFLNEKFIDNEESISKLLIIISDKLNLILEDKNFLEKLKIDDAISFEEISDEEERKLVKVINNIRNDYKKLIDIIERSLYIHYLIKEENEHITHKTVESERWPNWNLKDSLISMNLAKNYSNIIKFGIKYINDLSNQFDKLHNDIKYCLSEISQFCSSDKLTSNLQFYFLNYLVNNKIIDEDEEINKIISNISYNYIYFDYEKEIETISNLLGFDYLLVQFYIKFLDHFLKLTTDEVNIKENYFGSLSQLKEDEIAFLNEIFEVMMTILPKNQREVITKNIDNLPILFKFAYIYYMVQKENVCKSFLYYKLNMPINLPNENKNEEFYKNGLMIKKLSKKFVFNQEIDEDSEISSSISFETQELERIIEFYSKKFGNVIVNDNLIEIFNSLEEFIPLYKLFIKNIEDFKDNVLYCPLILGSDDIKLEFLNEKELNNALNNINSKIKPTKICEIIKGKGDNEVIIDEEFIDRNRNLISNKFNHPLIELKKLLESRKFGISFNEDQFIHSLVKNKIDQNYILDILKDLIDSSFVLENCFGKVKEFFDLYPYNIENLKAFSEIYQNNIDKIMERIKKGYNNA